MSLYFQLDQYIKMYFFKAVTVRREEPKLIVDISAAQSYCDDSWDTPTDQPSFRPEDLRAKSTQMM